MRLILTPFFLFIALLAASPLVAAADVAVVVPRQKLVDKLQAARDLDCGLNGSASNGGEHSTPATPPGTPLPAVLPEPEPEPEPRSGSSLLAALVATAPPGEASAAPPSLAALLSPGVSASSAAQKLTRKTKAKRKKKKGVVSRLYQVLENPNP